MTEIHEYLGEAWLARKQCAERRGLNPEDLMYAYTKMGKIQQPATAGSIVLAEVVEVPLNQSFSILDRVFPA